MKRERERQIFRILGIAFLVFMVIARGTNIRASILQRVIRILIACSNRPFTFALRDFFREFREFVFK